MHKGLLHCCGSLRSDSQHSRSFTPCVLHYLNLVPDPCEVPHAIYSDQFRRENLYLILLVFTLFCVTTVIMPKAYSEDWRWRVIWLHFLQNKSTKEISKQLYLSESSIERYIHLFNNTGDIAPKNQRHGPMREVTLLQTFLDTPSLYLHEVQKELHDITGSFYGVVAKISHAISQCPPNHYYLPMPMYHNAFRTLQCPGNLSKGHASSYSRIRVAQLLCLFRYFDSLTNVRWTPRAYIGSVAAAASSGPTSQTEKVPFLKRSSLPRACDLTQGC